MSQSAQAFIRALRASSDPPHPGGPLKIELAYQACMDTSLYIPNKSELVVEWILARFLKHKSKENHPLLDARYWQLLAQLLAADAPRTGTLARNVRAWLIPLINRIPIAPIIRDFFTLLASADLPTQGELGPLASQCIVQIWPLAAPKFTPEALLECFGAAIAFLNSEAGEPHSHTLAQTIQVVVQTYKTCLANTANKKKLYANFVQSHLTHWLTCAHRHVDDVAERSLVSAIFSSGVDTLFSLELLRQAGDQRLDDTLREGLVKALVISPDTVLSLLPRLFESYVHAIKKHKNTLFSQGSSQAPGHVATQVQTAGVAFYAAADELLADVQESDQLWRSRIALLLTVEKENLFDAHDESATQLLIRSGQRAAEVLKPTADALRISNAAEVLAILTRIDYDIMSAFLPAIMRRLALIVAVPSVLTYLGLLLDYHSKTRTTPAFLSYWLDAFSADHLRAAGTPPESYARASSGPLLARDFTSRLAVCIRSYLTPSQVIEAAEATCHTLTEGFGGFTRLAASAKEDSSEAPRKKRKKSGVPPPSSSSAELAQVAVSFAILARAAVVIFMSLPVHTVLETTRQDTLQIIQLAHSEIVPAALNAVLSWLGREHQDSWGWQIAATGALRVHYGLITCAQLGLDMQLAEDLADRMLAGTQSQRALPEFTLETFRSLFLECARGRGGPQTLVENALRYVELYIRESNVGWNGKAHVLSQEAASEQGAVALLHLLLDRWLPFLETHASHEQLEGLTTLLLSTEIAHIPAAQDETPRALDAHTIWVKTLRNAEFWEMHRFRDVMMARLQAATAPLDRHNLRTWLQETLEGADRIPLEDIRGVAAAFEVLLYAPAEYLPRNLRTELLHRALVADVEVDGSTRGDARPVLLVREFIRRTLAHVGTVDYPGAKEYAAYLLESSGSQRPSSSDESLLSVTLDILHHHFLSFVSNASKGEDDALISTFSLLARPVDPRRLSSFRQILSHRCLLDVISIVIAQEKSRFSSGFLQYVFEAQARMREVYLSSIQATTSLAQGGEIVWSVDVLQSWSFLLKLTRWLGISGTDMPQVGHLLVGKLLRETSEVPRAGRICASVSDILFAELVSRPHEERGPHLDCIVVNYLAASRLSKTEELEILDGQLSAACKGLSVEGFGYLLDTILETLSKPGKLPPKDLSNLVRLSNILIRDAPQGSLKTTQNHVTGALVLFADHSLFLTSPTLRSEVLELLNKHLNDHPAAIKPQDLSSIWSILGGLLSGSTEHDDATNPSVYHAVVGILSALVRLRRDLVLRSLPHLGIILGQLILALRGVRPQLGGKQTRLVMSTLPRWVSATHALGAEESKALARLLTTLLAKTLIRSHTQSVETQKPESLARPFSKHVAYVLTAYTRALNDTLCTVASQVRKELQPGLFALCEMMGEHSRDAMMVSALDAAGKATMKALWKDYEKQRYTGRG